jgi:hypothetical protein
MLVVPVHECIDSALSQEVVKGHAFAFYVNAQLTCSQDIDDVDAQPASLRIKMPRAGLNVSTRRL